jgi:hypothetical protein
MVIATRTLKLRRPGGNLEIPVRLFAPERQNADWSCKFEIGWPDGTLTMAAKGIDAVQALHLALQMIGAFIYSSDHHTSGDLMWQEQGKGYGFPVTSGIRDLLVGDDRDLF